MRDIRILPAEGEEGAIYARMLRLELEDAGYTVAIGMKLPEQVDFRLAVLDTDAAEARGAHAWCRQTGIPCLRYGKAPDAAKDEADGADEADEEAEAGYFPRPIAMDVFLTHCAMRLRDGKEARVGSALPQAALFLGTAPSDAAFRGKPLGLTPREHALLTCLYTHYGQTVTREALYRQVWGAEGESASNVVDVCAKNLRKKLDERFGLRLIHAVRGKGYRLLILPEGEAE